MNEKTKIESIWKNKESLIYIIIVFVFFGTGFFAKMFDNTFLENYQIYQQIANIVTGAILALILAVIMFYLGKKHDYKKNFIEKHFELKGIVMKYKIHFELFEKLLKKKHMKLFQELTIKQRDSKLEKEILKLQENIESFKKKIKNMENNLDELNELINEVLESTKETPKDFFYILILFVIGFSGNIFYSKNSIGDFYFQIAFVIVGITSFIILWNLEERMMKLLHERYASIIETKINFESWTLTLKNQIQDERELYQEIKTKMNKVVDKINNLKK